MTLKKSTILFYVALLCSSANAQESDFALATVKYEFVHVNDTNDRDNPRKEEMLVHLGQHASMYLSHTRSVRLKEMEDRMASTMAATAGASVRSVSFGGVSNENLFYFSQQNKLVLADAIGPTNYIIDLPDPAIDWQIQDEVKEIGGYEAQKATGSFAGRDYTVWFTTELPFPYGPWKLYGLPGLILEAADSKNEVIFNFLEFTKDTGDAIALPENALKTALKDFTKAKEAFQANPVAVMSGNIPAGATSTGTTRQAVTVSRSDGNTRTYTGDEAREMMEKSREEWRKKNNNPLELGVR